MRGNPLSSCVGPIDRLRNAHPATQWITILHGLEPYQAGLAAIHVSGPPHGGKAHRSHPLQAKLFHLLGERRRRRVVAHDDHIAPQQLAGVALQARLQPVRKKTDRSQCCHRQRHGNQQQTQLTRAPVTHQVSPSDSENLVSHG
ncbi:hypothetical protein D3C72_882250 [compost metagenome]